jgi:hypothetical protein
MHASHEQVLENFSPKTTGSEAGRWINLLIGG